MNIYNHHKNVIPKLIILLLMLLSNSIFPNPLQKAELNFSHERGFYYNNFTLEITCDIPSSKIRYTLDGSNPLISSTAIINNSPTQVLIDPTNFSYRDVAPGFIVTACATDSDTLVTDIVTSTYLFPEMINSLSRDNILPGSGWLAPGGSHEISYGMDPDIYNNSEYSGLIQEAFLSIPTISLVIDLASLFNPDSGIYVNALYHGPDWERASSLELLNPDGTEGFQINCGIRIRGGWSRHNTNPKHAFRFFFKREYGASKLKYPLFDNEGVDEFDKIDFRTSQNYSWSFYGDHSNTFLREIFSRDTQRDMNQPYTRSRYYHFYINGTYWGLYQTQERSEANFGESYFGGSDNEYDVIKVNVGENYDLYHVEATDGTLDKWKELWDAGELGFISDENYFKVQGLNPDLSPNPLYDKLLDVDNLIDYMLITFFTGDFDGPISGFRNNGSPNNFYAIYNRVNPDGFKFFRHDGEHTLFFNNRGTNRTGPYPAGENFEDSNPQWIHQKLSENKNYRLKFADRSYKHFYNNGVLSLDNNRKRIQIRKNKIESAIIAESARWGDSKSETPRTKADWESAVNFLLNDFLPSRNSIVINQLKEKGLFSSLTPPQFSIKSGVVEKGIEIELSNSGGEIFYTNNGTDPYSPISDNNSNFSKNIIEASALKRVLVPTSAQQSSWKSDLNFDDSNWLTCNGTSGGIGYDNKGVYNEYISLNIKNYMHESGNNPNTTCYIRIPFSVDPTDLEEMNFLQCDIMVDDGFVAYLNGVKVAESNVPSSLEWNSTSSNYLDANSFQRFDLTQYSNLLKSGENLLAIHGINTSLQSSDFLILPKLTIGNSSFGGSPSENAKLYSNPIEIDETTTIKARTFIESEWSALSENTFVIDEDLTNLKITELHYHPLDNIVNQDTISGKEFEFIELKNIGSSQLNLTESSFVNGISFTFPQGSIVNPDEFIIVASNSIAFNNRYGFLPDGEYEGQLNNGGEKIVFINAVNDTLYNFEYNDKLPWAEEADGDGYSLVSAYRNPSGNPNNSTYWIISDIINGSPKANDIVSNINPTRANTPIKFGLEQNYPNPFNPSTKIKYSIPIDGKVQIKIFDILGREVSILTNKIQKAGIYSIEFDGSNISSGIYFLRLYVFQNGESLTSIKSIKMVLMK